MIRVPHWLDRLTPAGLLPAGVLAGLAIEATKSQQTAVCHDCQTRHPCSPFSGEAEEFFARHQRLGHSRLEIQRGVDPKLAKLARITGADVFWPGRSGSVFEFEKLGIEGYRGNANVKEAFGTATVFTKTNANLATSATAGWMSNAIDNTSNLYDDMLVNLLLAAVNTAPANSKAIFLFAFGLVDGSGTAYTSTGDGTASGSEGTLTYPDVSTLPVVAPLLGVVPYPVQNKAINGGPFSVARCFGGILPPKNAVGMVNHSGMTLSVTNVGYVEVYFTVT